LLAAVVVVEVVTKVAVVAVVSCMQQITVSHLEIRMRSLSVKAEPALLGEHQAVVEVQAKIPSSEVHLEALQSLQMAEAEAVQTVEVVVDPIIRQLLLALRLLVQQQEFQDLQVLQQ
jgi:hypothetical protein